MGLRKDRYLGLVHFTYARIPLDGNVIGSMMAASTTTWYAYKDSKTGREYFHEPKSGKTSWILPTSASIDISEKNSESSSKFGTSKPNRNNQQQQQPTMKLMDKQSRSWAVGIITSVIIFNTIFLLVLTSYLYTTNQVPEQINSNDGINIQIPVKDRDEYIIQIDNTDVDIAKETTKSTYKYSTQSESDNETIVDDVQQDTDAQTPEDENSTTDNMEEKHTHYETEHSIDCKSNRGDINEDDYQAELHETHEPISTAAGKSCWVPFSYMLVGKCRRQAREGFGPLADADNTLWI